MYSCWLLVTGFLLWSLGWTLNFRLYNAQLLVAGCLILRLWWSLNFRLYNAQLLVAGYWLLAFALFASLPLCVKPFYF